MGGAIAQEFVQQFPDRVLGLVLCVTMCGGPRAECAPPPVVRVMRELDGLKPEEIAQRIWEVTYSPGYIENHRSLAEELRVHRHRNDGVGPARSVDVAFWADVIMSVVGGEPEVPRRSL